MPSGKRYAAQYKQLGALAAAQPAEIRERRTAAEEAYGAVRARLGAAGTYETVGGGPAPTEETPGILKQEQVQDPMARAIDLRYQDPSTIAKVTKVDKNALLGQLEGSTEFRIASRLTAESEQLIAREGPLWNEMVKNTQLPILEGWGAAARENAEAIRKAVQKGGSARREGMAAMVQMQEQNKINSARIQQISESRVALDKWARENARTQLEFNENWASNVAGVRETYNSAMDRASELMLNSAIPLMMQTTARAIEWREKAHAKQRDKANKWINGAIAVAATVAAVYTGGATLPMAFGFAGKALGDESVPSGIGETAGLVAEKYFPSATPAQTGPYPGGATYPARP